MVKQKIFIVGFLFVLLIIGFVACTKEDSNNSSNSQPNGNEVNYYVKYEASSSSYKGYGRGLTVKYTTELGTKTYINSNERVVGDSWEIICGPFKKGNIVRLVINGDYYVLGRISVGIDKESFVPKIEDNGSYSLELSHKLE